MQALVLLQVPLCYLDSWWTEAEVLAVKGAGTAGSAESQVCLDLGSGPGWMWCWGCPAESYWRRESQPGGTGVEAGAGAEAD